jgi:hypothetical protein
MRGETNAVRHTPSAAGVQIRLTCESTGFRPYGMSYILTVLSPSIYKDYLFRTLSISQPLSSLHHFYHNREN